MLGLGLSFARQTAKVFSYVKDSLKAYFRFYDTTPDFLLDGSTSFDGSNDYIDTGSTFQSTFRDSFTLSAWVKFDDGNPSGTTAIMGNRNSSGQDVVIFSIDTSGKLQVQYKSDNDNKYAVSNSAVFSNGATQWTHCVAVVDNSTSQIYLYVNGSVITLDGTNDGDISSITMGDFTIVDNLYIGARNENGTANMLLDGSLANVGIWNRALSASEIESIYWRGSYSELKGTELTNLVSWYDLDSRVQTGSDVVYDETNATLGDELITNGDFSSALGSEWDLTLGAGGGSISLVSNQLKMLQGGSSSTLYASQDFTTEVGATYQFTVDLVSSTATTWIKLLAGTSQNGSQVRTSGYSYVTAGATNALSFVATATTTWITIQESQGAGSSSVWDNVSVKKVSGNAGIVYGATTNSDSYSGESPFKPRVQDIATPKMAVQLADGSTSFDGSDDHIQISDHSTIQNIFASGGTLSLWLKTNSDGENDVGRIADKANWFFCTTGESAGVCDLRFLSVTSGDNGDWITTNTCVSNNEWTHVALVYNGSSTSNNPTIYVNGSSQALTENTTPASTQTSDASNDLYIGNRADGIACFDGKMANFSIHSSELTQTQIQELMFTEKYSGLSSDLKTNLVSWYDLGSTELGSELITNGGFDSNTTGWNATRGTLSSVSGGQSGNCLSVERDSGSDQSGWQEITAVVGKTYKLTAWVKSGTSGADTFHIQLASSSDYERAEGTSSDTWTQYSTIFTATATTMYVTLRKSSSASGTMLFDEATCSEVKVEDLQGSNDGTVYGATTTTGYTSSPHGVVDPLNYGELYSGRALDFDGSNDYVNIPDDNSLDFGTGDFSVSGWFKWERGSASDDSVGGIQKYDGSTGWYFRPTTGNNWYQVTHDGSESAGAIDMTGWDDGQWHHIVGVWDRSSTFSAYLDGVKSSSTVDITGSDGSGINNATALDIGGASGTWATDYWDGKISNVKVFNSVLTQAQIRELYTKPETVLPTGVSASNLKLDLPMQEGAGSYVYDGSGNQNHGTISGASWATGESDGYQSSLVRSNTPMIFDGSNDYVDCGTGLGGNIGDNYSGSLTFSMWFKTDVTSGDDGLFNMSSFSGTHGEMGIVIDSNLIKFHLNNGGWTRSFSFTDTDNWHHLICVYKTGSESESVMYLDGSLQSSSTSGSFPSASDMDFSGLKTIIGGYVSSSYTLDGIINEVAVWDVALDADAVTALYNSGTPLLPTSDSGNYDNSDDLRGYWRNDGIATWTDRTPLGVYGSDMITNGGFDSDTVWTRQSGWTIGSGVATCDGTNGSYIYQSSGVGGLPKNTKISVSLDITSYTSGSVRIGATLVTSDTVSGLGTHTAIFTTRSGGDSGIEILSNSFIGSIDNVVIKKYRGDNDGTASGSPVSIVIPEGSTSGRDSQGFLLSDTTSISNGMRFYENEYISLGKSEVLNNIFEGGGTFEAWIYAKTWGESDTARIASKSNSNDIGWNIFIEQGGSRLYLRSDWSTTDMLRYATSAINLNQWHHIAITYNSTATAGTDPVIYVDGVSKTLSGTASAGTVVDDSPSTLEIGRRAGGGDREWDGLIDEVRIYDNALSSSEVTKNYNNGKSAHQ